MNAQFKRLGVQGDFENPYLTLRPEFEARQVEIFGEMYPLKSEEADVEYMKKLAAMVDKNMREAAKKTRSFSGNKISVLAALQLADDYCRLQKDYDELLALLEEK